MVRWKSELPWYGVGLAGSVVELGSKERAAPGCDCGIRGVIGRKRRRAGGEAERAAASEDRDAQQVNQLRRIREVLTVKWYRREGDVILANLNETNTILCIQNETTKWLRFELGPLSQCWQIGIPLPDLWLVDGSTGCANSTTECQLFYH